VTAVKKGAIGRWVDQPDSGIRFYLLFGPDIAQSRALGTRLVAALGANRFMIISNAIKSDPAALADEAGALSLFGGRRVIWVEPAGEEIADGVAALLEAPAPENPVVAIAGDLKKSSGLRKLAEASAAALAFAAYAPEGEDAERMVIDLGRRHGLKISPPVASRIAAACAADQAIAAREIEKLALYLDASPNAPKPLEQDAVDAVGAVQAEGNFLRLADLALGGDMAALMGELERLSPGGSEAIPVVRSLQRRLLMLAPARARIERGESPAAVMASFGRSLFWKDRDMIAAMLGRWRAADLATAAERAGKLERQLMFSDAPVAESLGEELIAVARAARRR
jgi:DNA polymerase-3 subunit delta